MLRRIALVVCLVGLAGCLRPVTIPTVALNAPSGGFAQLPESLGVVEFADLRPRAQRRGKAPWLVPLIVWNQRIGRYVTSSEHFGGDVSHDVTRAVAEALSGWRFGHGRALDAVEDATASDYCERDELEYVATGQIHHLYGAVRQRAWLFFIPTPWIQGILSGNEIGDPVGVVRLSLRIQDCRSGEEIVSRRFRSEGVFPRLSPSAAAQRAFDALIRDVALLSRVPSDGGASSDDADETEPPEPSDAPSPPAPEPEPDPGEAPPEMVPL